MDCQESGMIRFVCVLLMSLALGEQAFAKDKLEIFEGYKYEIPNNLDYQVSDATFEHYYLMDNSKLSTMSHRFYFVSPSNNPVEFEKNLKTHKTIEEQLKHKSIFSYIYFDGASIVYDALPPKGRFEKIDFNEKSYFPSHSMGKSITSYMLGHAICNGYIESVDDKIADWPLMENTLYYGQPIINLLNMKAGDTNVIRPKDTRFIKTGRHIHSKEPLLRAVQTQGELKNTKPIESPKFAYSNLTTDILFNYIMHRVGSDFDTFVSEFYQNKIGIKYPVYLSMNDVIPNWKSPTTERRIAQGSGQYSIYATRYDYLRIAKAIMGDWKNDTCEGKYLKEIYQRAVDIEKKRSWKKGSTYYPTFAAVARKYAGQFWVKFPELYDQSIMALVGADGQQIVINMDKSRIVVISAGQEGFYNTKKLALGVIKKGKISSGNWN